MPELPEVETTRRGLEPHLVGRLVHGLEVREPRLRWPLEPGLGAKLRGARISAVGRRGKYLLLTTGAGTLLVHLGMSGSLRYLDARRKPAPHDHVDVLLDGGGLLRFNDPRRFGSLHLTDDPAHHPLLAGLGPEPLGPEFTPDYLWRVSRGRRVAIKAHLMNSRIVAGVGNIYASEALFRAGIHPARAAGRIARSRFPGLVDAVRATLGEAIAPGGTTLRDYVNGAGEPGWFQVSLRVYDRDGGPCPRCDGPIRKRVLGQRASYYCPRCQR